MHDRHAPHLYATAALPLESVTRLTSLTGLEGRVVSADEASGASTIITTVPAGWRCAHPVESGRCDIFVIQGDLRAGAARATTAGLLTLWADEPAELASDGGAQAIVFSEPDERPADSVETTPIATQAWDRPWEMAVTAGMPQGLLRRRLQRDDADGAAGPPRGWIRMIKLLPGWCSPNEERHVGCWEENIMLSGEVMHIGRGHMGAGDCLANPPGLWHGPMATKGGALFVVHCDAPMPVEYRPHPPGPEVLDRYLREEPWIAAPAEHAPAW